MLNTPFTGDASASMARPLVDGVDTDPTTLLGFVRQELTACVGMLCDPDIAGCADAHFRLVADYTVRQPIPGSAEVLEVTVADVRLVATRRVPAPAAETRPAVTVT